MHQVDVTAARQDDAPLPDLSQPRCDGEAGGQRAHDLAAGTLHDEVRDEWTAGRIIDAKSERRPYSMVHGDAGQRRRHEVGVHVRDRQRRPRDRPGEPYEDDGEPRREATPTPTHTCHPAFHASDVTASGPLSHQSQRRPPTLHDRLPRLVPSRSTLPAPGFYGTRRGRHSPAPQRSSVCASSAQMRPRSGGATRESAPPRTGSLPC